MAHSEFRWPPDSTPNISGYEHATIHTTATTDTGYLPIPDRFLTAEVLPLSDTRCGCLYYAATYNAPTLLLYPAGSDVVNSPYCDVTPHLNAVVPAANTPVAERVDAPAVLTIPPAVMTAYDLAGTAVEWGWTGSHPAVRLNCPPTTVDLPTGPPISLDPADHDQIATILEFTTHSGAGGDEYVLPVPADSPIEAETPVAWRVQPVIGGGPEVTLERVDTATGAATVTACDVGDGVGVPVPPALLNTLDVPCGLGVMCCRDDRDRDGYRYYIG